MTLQVQLAVLGALFLGRVACVVYAYTYAARVYTYPKSPIVNSIS